MDGRERRAGYAIAPEDTAPLVVGGLGGSGTRVVTRLLQQLGVEMGGSLNGSLDNMWFSLLFVRRSILLKPQAEIERLLWLFVNAMRRGEDVSPELRELARQAARYAREPVLPLPDLEEACASLLSVGPRERGHTLWGWKQPNTHIMLGMLDRYFPAMKFIYVVRNGLDMAFSENQNQLSHLWGDLLLEEPVEATPRCALRYWVASYRRLLEEGAVLGDRLLVLNFDRLCEQPLAEIRRLSQFAGCVATEGLLRQLADGIGPPDSLGRYRTRDCSDLDPEDVAFVQRMGFDADI